MLAAPGPQLHPAAPRVVAGHLLDQRGDVSVGELSNDRRNPPASRSSRFVHQRPSGVSRDDSSASGARVTSASPLPLTATIPRPQRRLRYRPVSAAVACHNGSNWSALHSSTRPCTCPSQKWPASSPALTGSSDTYSS